MTHDLTGNELYLKERDKGGLGWFKRASILFGVFVMMFSIAGMVEI